MSNSSPLFLPEEPARKAAMILMDQLENFHCIDFSLTKENRDSRCSTDSLFSGKKGVMFGVMTAKNKDNENIVLKSFSGQYSGLWLVEGWAPPLIDSKDFSQLTKEVDPKIKDISHRIDDLLSHHKKKTDQILIQDLRKERRELSVKLNQDIQNLYMLENFSYMIKPVKDFFRGNPPTGTGDCNAPKLINYARKLLLQPISMVEFFWGKEALSGNRKHKHFYPPCKERCLPIIPFLLSGGNKK